MQPSIAVIIRTKDRPLLLSRALYSVNQQTYDRWEIVVVNNGGDISNLQKTINDFKMNTDCSPIKIINLHSAEFMEVATNNGIRSTECEYIAILDDDDTWHPFFLENCMEILEENDSVDGVVTQSTIVYEKIKDGCIEEERRINFNPNLTRVKKFSILRRNLYTTNSFVYKKENIKLIGSYREDLPVLGDWEFNVRFVLNRRIEVIAQPLSYYHKRIDIDLNSSTYANTNHIDHLRYDNIIRKEYYQKFQREGKLLEAIAILLFGYLNRYIGIFKKIFRYIKNGRIK